VIAVCPGVVFFKLVDSAVITVVTLCWLSSFDFTSNFIIPALHVGGVLGVDSVSRICEGVLRIDSIL